MNPDQLREAVESLAAQARPDRAQALPIVDALLTALETGEVRAAVPHADGWRVSEWVKQGILLGFRIGENVASRTPPAFFFRDRDTFPTWDPKSSEHNVRIVPGGTTVRRGVHFGSDVVIMPPAYVNVGAWVGAGTMIDSHVLVGSCAQVGCRVHLSAAAQIGGVLEPVGALPVIVEDDVFVGGGAGVYEGTRVQSAAVLAAGVVLTRAVPIIDLVRQTEYRAEPGQPLIVPERAVVVAGARPAAGEYARDLGIQIQAAVIVKYRDPGTDAQLALEGALR